MPRKKSIDKPSVSTSEPAAGATSPKTPRAPRQAAAAVTHKHKKSTTPVAVGTTTVPQAGQAIAVQAPTHEEIAALAYLIAESRGFQGGCPDDDWFRAERELASERQSNIE